MTAKNKVQGVQLWHKIQLRHFPKMGTFGKVQGV